MKKSTTLQNNNQSSTETIQIDLQRLVSKLLSWWWLFILFLILTFTIGYLNLRYATYEYSTKATILIKDAGRSGILSEESILLGQGLTGGSKSMDNEIQILRSLPLMEKVVKLTGINVSYYRIGKLKDNEFYSNAPIKLDTFSLINGGAYGVSFFIQTQDDKSFLLKYKEEDEEGETYYYNVPFNNKYGYFKITAVEPELMVPGLYRINIAPIENIARRYSSRLNLERVGSIHTSSVLQLSLRDPVPDKAEEIINTLISIYNQAEIDDENQVLRNTLDFIDERLKKIEKELNVVEGDIERFKSRNSIITESASSSMDFALGEIRVATQQISQYEVEKTILASVEQFMLQDQSIFELIPANLSAETPSLNQMIVRHNEMILEHGRLKKIASVENPVRQQLEKEILDNRDLIIITIKNLQKDLEIPIQKLSADIDKLEKNMISIPSIEKGLIEQMRLQGIKENLFLMLLEKREETALSEAVTTAGTRIIDAARSSGSPVYPKKQLVYMACSILGLVIPLLFIGLLALFSTKIDSEDTVKQLTSIPIYGRIAQNKDKTPIVVKSGERSAVNEMFRQLRTNLNYLSLENDNRIFAVTSSVPGEGKTFIALNLSITLALANKKVALVELDLRKPRFKDYIGLPDNDRGVTNFLVGEKSLNEVTRSFEGTENLSIISSGPIPPNPSELILSDRMEELVRQLAEKYDYIIFDNPPIGLVSDALLLRKYVNNILIVARHQYTRKSMIQNLEEMYQNEDLPNVGIVLNGIKYRKRGYYGYGGYSYGNYARGYYQ